MCPVRCGFDPTPSSGLRVSGFRWCSGRAFDPSPRPTRHRALRPRLPWRRSTRPLTRVAVPTTTAVRTAVRAMGRRRNMSISPPSADCLKLVERRLDEVVWDAGALDEDATGGAQRLDERLRPDVLPDQQSDRRIG